MAEPTPAQVAAAREDRVRPNDNRARAGILSGRVLALRLEARVARWHPNGDDGPGAAIPVFAEIGRAAQVPGPLIRVPGGTDIIATVRNLLPTTLTIHGLHSRPAVAVGGAQFNDSVQLAPGAIRTLRFRLDRPGTYYYWGKTTPDQPLEERTGEDAQLTGVIVVDEPGERPARDRIFVIGAWTDGAGSEVKRKRQRELFVINGRAWPHTDRLTYSRGETVRWRVVNASADLHPMHLHGFYFRVNRRGDGTVDTLSGGGAGTGAASTRGDLVNTETMAPGSTMSLTWVPDRLGNWLFHCHIPEHMAPRGALGFPMPTFAQAGAPMTPPMTHGTSDMGGLVTAIEIKPAEDDTAATVLPPEPAKKIRMLMRPNLGSSPGAPLYGIAFHENGMEPAQDSGQRAGPPLILTRGVPVSIMVVNQTPEPTSVHWHGIELESFYDGVPGVSGIKPELSPAIASADSFEVHLTPPRAGTFIYHSHVNESRQQRAGLAGALIVAEKAGYDANRNIPLLITSPSDGVDEEVSVLLNGDADPAPLSLRRGVAYRIRLINISTRPGLRVELREDTSAVTWRALAKDGAELPQASRVMRPARQSLSIGETMDVEFSTARVSDYRLEVKTARGNVLNILELRVR